MRSAERAKSPRKHPEKSEEDAMNALILNGERNNENMLHAAEEILRKELVRSGWQTDSILLREKKIAPCTGCFFCWMKTPGICTINDFGREVARMAAGSEFLVFLTPITFGGYSSELKKAVDRFSCCMLLPFFTEINGETHHKPRYNPLPGLIGIGMLPAKDEESERIFRDLVARNAINLHSRRTQSTIVYESQARESVAGAVRSLLSKLEERR
jgi:hypothetical protein